RRTPDKRPSRKSGSSRLPPSRVPRRLTRRQGPARRCERPASCRVTTRSGLGQTRNLHVVTWLGPEQAMAMAARAGGRGYGTSDGIYDVAVDDPGPAERDERGLVVIGADLRDRMEF